MKIRIALPETILSAMKIQTVQDTVEVAIVTAMVSYIYKYLKENQQQIPPKFRHLKPNIRIQLQLIYQWEKMQIISQMYHENNPVPWKLEVFVKKWSYETLHWACQKCQCPVEMCLHQSQSRTERECVRDYMQQSWIHWHWSRTYRRRLVWFIVYSNERLTSIRSFVRFVRHMWDAHHSDAQQHNSCDISYSMFLFVRRVTIARKNVDLIKLKSHFCFSSCLHSCFHFFHSSLLLFLSFFSLFLFRSVSVLLSVFMVEVNFCIYFLLSVSFVVP